MGGHRTHGESPTRETVDIATAFLKEIYLVH